MQTNLGVVAVNDELAEDDELLGEGDREQQEDYDTGDACADSDHARELHFFLQSLISGLQFSGTNIWRIRLIQLFTQSSLTAGFARQACAVNGRNAGKTAAEVEGLSLALFQGLKQPGHFQQRLRELVLKGLPTPEEWLALTTALGPGADDLLLQKLLVTCGHWVRSPLTFDASAGVSIYSHLYSRYPEPACLQLYGWQNALCGKVKWLFWQILLVQGGSLARMGPQLGWHASGKLLQALFQIDGGIPAEQAYLYAQVYLLGGQHREATLLWRAPFARHLSEELLNPAFRSFWESTVTWLVACREGLDDVQVSACLEWAHQQYLQGQATGVPFSWRRRTLRGVLAAVEEARQLQRNPWIFHRWAHLGLDLSLRHADACWSMTELCSGRLLDEESTAMHHCVVSYAPQCVEGEIGIFSLRREGQRVLTVEVGAESWNIRQARGHCNRRPEPVESEVLAIWQDLVNAPHNGLAVSASRA